MGGHHLGEHSNHGRWDGANLSHLIHRPHEGPHVSLHVDLDVLFPISTVVADSAFERLFLQEEGASRVMHQQFNLAFVLPSSVETNLEMNRRLVRPERPHVHEGLVTLVALKVHSLLVL